jgi:hypothetical protein
MSVLALPSKLARLAFVVLLAAAGTSIAHGTTSVSDVVTLPGLAPVHGAASTLVRGESSVAVVLRTGGLEPLAPYTIWWVVFNAPEGCLGACDADDIFAPDGSLAINANADLSILFAGGTMTDDTGSAAFSAMLMVGEPLGQVVYGPGLRDAATAEIHVVVRSHGPLDPARAFEQLTTFEAHPAIGGGCGDCADMQAAIHLPMAARSGSVYPREIPWYVLHETRMTELAARARALFAAAER